MGVVIYPVNVIGAGLRGEAYTAYRGRRIFNANGMSFPDVHNSFLLANLFVSLSRWCSCVRWPGRSRVRAAV